MDDKLEHRLNKKADNDIEQYIKDFLEALKDDEVHPEFEQWYNGAKAALHDVLDEIVRLKKEGYL